MKAVILAGGLGTRLRPLTFSMPKPLIPMAGPPMVRHIIDPLPKEVDTVILAVSYMKDLLERYFRENDVGRDIILINEDEPMGTGGALKNVSKWLDDTFFAFNGDVICSIDLTTMLEVHKAHRGIGTMALWPVSDPSAFGVAATDDLGRITTFQEKPPKGKELSNKINAGAYIFEPALLDHISEGVVSLEREVFPHILHRSLYGYTFDGYWIDAGTRENFLCAQHILLDRGQSNTCGIDNYPTGVRVIGNNLIETDYLEPSTIGPNVYVENGAKVCRGATISNSLIMEGAIIGNRATVLNCMVGPGAIVDDGVTISDEILA
ncbi:MAG: NDP-sugar synthase [Euryarchaeota archaeon]|nr:NDP-sugar synthase [Euryarchaeota archaeon]